MTATLTLNGAPEPLAPSVTALLDRLGLDSQAKGLAIALNGAVLPRAAWADAALKAGDDVEIVRPFQGG